MVNRASYLTRQTLWLCFLFQYESVGKPCMTNAQSGYNDLFSSRCSKSWSPFSQGGLNLEEFIIDVHVPSLLLFFVREFTDYRFQIGIWNGDSFRALIYARFGYRVCSFVSSHSDLAWNPTQNYFLWLDIESSLLSNLTINGFTRQIFLGKAWNFLSFQL